MPLLLFCALLCGAASGSSIPAELRRAAAAAENDHQGIVGFIINWDTEARGGPFHQHYHYRYAYAYDGERFLGARALEKVDNGRAAGQADLELETKRIEAENRKPGTPGFAVPFDARHFNEYGYQVAPCELSCLDGDVTIVFTSALDDPNHGKGHLIVDRDGHVRHLEYSPNVKPAFANVHAKEALVSIDRAPVLPGFWATVKMESRYAGRFGIVSGEATQTTKYEHYRRFTTSDAALSALHSGEI